MRAGDLIGRFRIRRYLDRGATSRVYEAEDEDGQPAALKVLDPEHRGAPELLGRFINEAHPIKHLDHPGLPRILEVTLSLDGAPYIAMDLLGPSLAQQLLHGPMCLGTALRLLAQLAAVLSYVHAYGIVHRDVKPSNVLYAGPERVKLVDFGLAKFPESTQLPALSLSTTRGACNGTPHYRAPEQWLDSKSVDDRADVYSLGVLLYEMLTGVPPFYDVTRGRLRMLHVMAPPPALDAPPDLQALYVRMLAKSPALRPAAAEVAAQLKPYCID